MNFVQKNDHLLALQKNRWAKLPIKLLSLSLSLSLPLLLLLLLLLLSLLLLLLLLSLLLSLLSLLLLLLLYKLVCNHKQYIVKGIFHHYISGVFTLL